MNDDKQTVIGNTVPIKIAQFNATLMGKVDTGATTSSLHATNISMNGDTVTFNCPELSDNTITTDYHSSQTVVSADAGGQKRPTIKLDVEVNGVSIPQAVFNLNDRGEMDSPILIGQNILQAGGFVIDVNLDTNQQEQPTTDQPVAEAISLVMSEHITIYELVEYIRTAPRYVQTESDTSPLVEALNTLRYLTLDELVQHMPATPLYIRYKETE